MINLIKCSAKILYKKLIIIFLIIYKRPKFKKIKLKILKPLNLKLKEKFIKFFN